MQGGAAGARPDSDTACNSQVVISRDAGKEVAVIPGFWPKSQADELAALCDSIGFADRPRERARYSQSTVDLEVDRYVQLREWLVERGFVSDLYNAISSTFECLNTIENNIVCFDDVFVVKYSQDGQRQLESHVDAGKVSAMLALSSRGKDYSGGGTKFDDLPAPIHLDKGDLIIFNAFMRHQGLAISSGTRYLLVAFCHTSTVELRQHGNVGLDLRPLRGCTARFGTWTVAHLESDFFHEKLVKAASELSATQKGSGHVSTQWVDWFEKQQPESSKPAFINVLGKVARDLAQFHVERLGLKMEWGSGIEFWVQALDGGGQDKAHFVESIPWHRDKDEQRYLRCGDEIYPAIATVTYLTGCRESFDLVPTVVLDANQVVVSFPSRAKHLAFKGSLLHGCPAELVDLTREMCGTRKAKSEGPGALTPRLTLLVNVWPEHLPEQFATSIPSLQSKRRRLQTSSPKPAPSIANTLMRESPWHQVQLNASQDEMLQTVLEKPAQLRQALMVAINRWPLSGEQEGEENCRLSTFVLSHKGSA